MKKSSRPVAAAAGRGSEKRSTDAAAVSDIGYSLPNSRKVYVAGKQHADLRVPYFVIPSGVEGSLTISLIV